MFAIVMLAFFIYLDSKATTIDAQGESVIEEMPDRVVVYFNIEAKHLSAQVAKDRVAEIVNNVTNALYSAGINKEQITTQNYNIYPNWVWKDNERKQEGYIARQGLRVESEKFDKAGEIIDLGVDNGALVSHINFELSKDKQNELKAKALKKATEDAKLKAEGIAVALGKKLGRVVEVRTTNFNYYPYPLVRSVEHTEEAKEATTNIQPKKIEIRASVSVKFKVR